MQQQFDTVGRQGVGLGVEAPLTTLPSARGYLMVGREYHFRRFLLLAITIAQVNMIPGAHDIFFSNRSLRHCAITLRHHDRPATGGPADAAHMTEHNRIGYPIVVTIGITSLRGIEPMAVAIIKDSTVADTHPSVVAAKLVRMGNDRIGIAAKARHISTVDTQIRSVDMLRTDNARIIRYVETIISQEQVIVAVTIDDLGRFCSLPAVAFLTRKDTLAISLSVFGSPRIAQFLHRLAGLRINLNDGESTVPRAVGQPVLTFWCDDIRRVDSIPEEIAIRPIVGSHLVIQFLV